MNDEKELQSKYFMLAERAAWLTTETLKVLKSQGKSSQAVFMDHARLDAAYQNIGFVLEGIRQNAYDHKAKIEKEKQEWRGS